jgi:hypothetical protein
MKKKTKSNVAYKKGYNKIQENGNDKIHKIRVYSARRRCKE